jgi:hypothetical protein
MSWVNPMAAKAPQMLTSIMVCLKSW